MSDPAARTPPEAPLHEVVAALESRGLTVALGGSGLLAALGLVDEVRDWDLTVDADPPALHGVLPGEGWVLRGGDALHADHKFSHDGRRIEVICRFAFHVPGGVVRIPVAVSRRWRDLPVAAPEAWAVAYALLAEGEASARRRERSELLFGRLAREGADPVVVKRLLEEPLPAALHARLATLPSR